MSGGWPVDRPRRGVMERRPGHVAGGAVGSRPALADAGLHVGLDFRHHPGNGPVACRVQLPWPQSSLAKARRMLADLGTDTVKS